MEMKYLKGEVIYHSQELEEKHSDKSYIISNGPIFDYERKKALEQH